MDKKILIVEDELDIQKVLKANLDAEGYQTLVTETAEGAIKLVDEEKPSLVILDVMLPDGNGFDVCKKIKEKNEFIRVIIYTGKLEAVDARKARESGADDFTVKTVDFKYILKSIKQLTE